jgi:hypothetical protein
MTTNDPPAGAVRLGFASSRAGESPRWSEVSIFRTADGEYTAQRIGRSAIAGEADLPATFTARDPRELVRWLSRPGRKGARVPVVATSAIAAAAASDAAFAAGLVDELDVEQYGAAEPRDGSLVVELRRDDQQRAVRFCGRTIAHGAAPASGSAVAIFAVDDGTYAVSIVGDDRADDNAARYRAVIGVDARTVVDALRFRGGWTRVARRALHAAAIAEPRFAAGVDGLLRAGLPPPAMILRDGDAYVRFAGTRIASTTAPAGLEGTETAVVFRRRDAGGGYVVGTIVADDRDGGQRARVALYATAAQLVDAQRDERAALLAIAAQRDPDVAAALGGSQARTTP